MKPSIAFQVLGLIATAVMAGVLAAWQFGCCMVLFAACILQAFGIFFNLDGD